jgi:indole-3-glycerol phosphate synthase
MILDDILRATRADLPARKAARPLATLEATIADLGPTRDLARALRQRGRVTAISEFKRRSPSAGWIREGAEIADVVPRYLGAGAAALSILTDETFFGGTLKDLREARPLATAPILRKDFIVDEYQIAEARAAGADAILLIVAALDDSELRTLYAATRRWGIHALVEAHDAVEVARAVALEAPVIGINHRDLSTFTVDTTLAARLRQAARAERSFERTAKLLEKHAAQAEAGEYSLEPARLHGDWAEAETADGQPASALSHLRIAHERHPELFDVARRLSAMLAGQGDRKGAMQTLESFLALGKDPAEIEQARAQLAKLRAGGA